ncbi:MULTISPECIES: hypothetical protein [unclassified Rathayibacter]|uniref:hypothetical protein n=1 Tax=unclassified Rathayibacter TaxID=2609250 RepID=UPI0006F4C6C1|nr:MULTISPECIES: hypothetical protein [unclassified Rathayibacter]KQQ03609.1 hypothetical protein ASF42_08930 [Rathayibacter sp. Leaf294]KQS12065.1 hypothetical protein ASG06_08930 [Rathayibacter sp. Leaf185]
MLIRNAHSADEIGGWRIGGDVGTGARGDAASVLRRIAGAPGLRLMLRETGAPPGPFGSLLRSYISAY